MLGVISNHNVCMSSCQLSTPPPPLHHILLKRRAEAPEATVRPANMRFMLHDVATRWVGPQSVFISELSCRLHRVNGTIGLTGASCCHVSAEKDVIEACFVLQHSSWPRHYFHYNCWFSYCRFLYVCVCVCVCVCRCSACLVHYPSSTVGCFL